MGETSGIQAADIGTIGMVGLGSMGGAIAKRLLAAGLAPHIWGRSPERLSAFVDAGCVQQATLKALAQECDVILVCVSDTDAVESVLFDPEGIASADHPGLLVVDHSTIHPLRTAQFAERLGARGIRLLDVPVTGGVVAADAGTLVLMAGGEHSDIESLSGLFDCYAQRVTRMGAAGAGQATKIANQMIIGANVAVVAEALNYASNFGVNAALLPDALAGGWADSAVLQNHARRMAAADYDGDVNARIMAKDIDIACDMGRETGSPLPVTAQVQQMYRRLIAEGDADRGQIGLMWLYSHNPLG